MDQVLIEIAVAHKEVKFVKINAEKTPFFVRKLMIKVLPSVVFFQDGVAFDRLVGFQGLDEKHSAKPKIRVIEDRISATGFMLSSPFGTYEDDADESSDEEFEDEAGPSIGTYTGDTNENGERHGQGRAELPNGDVYEGHYENGKRHGKGVYRFKKNKAKYDGDYHQGKKQGEGKFWYPDGSVYEGSWSDDQRSGQGIYKYPNSDEFSGGWAVDAKDGFGVYTYAATGARYEGQWSSGKRHGEGKFSFDQYTYDGGFTDDQALGQGKFAFDHGATQTGNFVVDGADDLGDEEEAKKSTIWKNDV